MEMYVYAVELVTDDEYGCTSVQRVFASRAKAQAYIDAQIAREHEEDEEYDGRFYPWYDESGEGIPLWSISEWAVH